MKKFLCFLSIFMCLQVMADDGSKAARKAVEAWSKTESGKKTVKGAEKLVNQIIPVKSTTAKVIGTTAITLADGRVTTKHFNNLGFEVLGGKVRTDLEYKFNDSHTHAIINAKWEW